MRALALSASLHREEAVLRFPYDEGMRQLLRAIPGRRWDPEGRAWRVPLGPEQARALERLLAALPASPDVSAELARAIRRSQRRRERDGCLVDVARPDHDWWLSFATDGAPAVTDVLLAHPRARRLPPIGRALVPLDDHSLQLVADLRAAAAGGPASALRLTPAAQRALEAVTRPGGAREARRAREAGTRESGAREPRAPEWRGIVDAGRAPEGPAFLLLGDPGLLPAELRRAGRDCPGGSQVPLDARSLELIEHRLRCWLTPSARRSAEALREGRPPPPAVLELSRVHPEPTFVLAPGHDERLAVDFAAIRGAAPAAASRGGADEHAGLPSLRADPFCVPGLDRFLRAGDAWVSPLALERLQDIRQEHAAAAGLVELSQAHDAPLEVPGLGGELKPFQRAGVSYLLERRRAFLADEQGLGKTIEAIAAAQAAGAFPAIVVCPASLKLMWLRELGRWLPGRRSIAISGTRARPRDVLHGQRALRAAAVVVVNYEILAARLPELCSLRPQAVVLDEAHHCKNPSAQRTRAAAALAAAVPAGGLVLALTGTPVTSRADELIAQLRILGRLDEFGSGARFGARFRGPDAHVRLHWHLRARCFVRRRKADVLAQLPPKTRAIVPVELDNEAEYRLAERDVVAWLESQPLDLRELDAKVAAALRAERLVRLNALKLLAVRGKLRAALAWVHEFTASGERLVVFARHREIQRALLARFPGALHVLGQDGHAAREQAVERFQAPDSPANRLIICSIDVAGHGITLTRARNVAFVELEWTPAKHDQAEDRCHRIGQHDAVGAYYLLAAGTVDESIAALLERKRAVVGAVTDGREEDEEGVLDALVRELRGRPYRHLRAVA